MTSGKKPYYDREWLAGLMSQYKIPEKKIAMVITRLRQIHRLVLVNEDWAEEMSDLEEAIKCIAHKDLPY